MGIEVVKPVPNAEIKISGMINEDFRFEGLDWGAVKTLKVDLEQVKSINSCGIREWIKWLNQMGSAQIELFHCHKIIIDQVNMVQGFLPSNAKVRSFYVPFYNEDFGSEKNILLEYGKDFDDKTVRVPENVTDDDGNPMEIDVIEAKYFKFIGRS